MRPEVDVLEGVTTAIIVDQSGSTATHGRSTLTGECLAAYLGN